MIRTSLKAAAISLLLASAALAASGDLLVPARTRAVPVESGMKPETPVFSPDGTLLAFAAGTQDNTRVFVLTVASDNTRAAFSAAGARIGTILFSPDGLHLAAVVTDEGGSFLAAGPADGTLTRIKGTEGLTGLRWAGTLAVCALKDGRAVWKPGDKEADPFEKLPAIPGGPYHPIAWSANGQWCAAAKMLPSPTTGLVRSAGLYVWKTPSSGNPVEVKEILSPDDWLIGVFKSYPGTTSWAPDSKSIRFVGTRLEPVAGYACRPLAVWEIRREGGKPRQLFEYGWWPKRFQMRPGGFGLIAWRYDMGSASFCTDLLSGETYRYESGAPGRGPFTFGPGCTTVALARWDDKKKEGSIVLSEYTVKKAPPPVKARPAGTSKPAPADPTRAEDPPKPAPPPPANFKAGAADITVTTDRSPHPRTRSSIVRVAMKDAKTDKERAIALWEFVHTHMYHYDNHGGSVWDVLCTYGCSLCGTMWRMTAWLANDPLVLGPGNAGGGGLQKWYDNAVERRDMCRGWLIDSYMIGSKTLETPVSLDSGGGTGGHTMGELFFGGRSHFMDPMAGFFVYTADGDHIASLDEIKGDQSLVGDPVRMSEPFMPCDSGKAIFFYRTRGGASGKGNPIPDGPPHAMNLRSGMRYVRYYGKTFSNAFHLPPNRRTRYVEEYWKDGPRHYCDRSKGPRHRGNGEIVFEPGTSPLWRQAPTKKVNLASDLEGGLHAEDGGKGFSFALEFETIYIFPSGRITGTAYGAGAISITPTGAKSPTVIWTGQVGGKSKLDVTLHDVLSPRRPRAFRLEAKMEPGARLEQFRTSGIFQYNYFVSPRLLEGKNRITVNWAKNSPMENRAVRILWSWNESNERKEHVHTAKKHGEHYSISVGDLSVPNGGISDPTFMEKLEIEVVPAD
ncbi:hypothetical protein ACFL01_02135 [Planctomycetota bacterium]